jgi:type IV pilus assembly protein PilP
MMANQIIMQRLKLSVIFILVCIAGCQQEKQDLNAYVSQVKAKQKSDIPPIPVMKPYQKFDYAAMDLRDPFIPTVVEVPEPEEEPIIDNGISPDQNRRKEALEAYELAELQYVGVLEQEQMWALIRAGDGVIHRVQVGNYMGKNHGRILSIEESALELEEIVSNGRKGFIKRNNTVKAVEVK